MTNNTNLYFLKEGRLTLKYIFIVQRRLETMPRKRLLPFLLSLTLLGSCLPTSALAYTEKEKTQRRAYIHAQGETPPEKSQNVSYVYMGDIADIYFAVDDPNKGEYKNGVHAEPKYDMNGYKITLYYDQAYFKYTGETPDKPVDFTLPDKLYGDGTNITNYWDYKHVVTKDVDLGDGRLYTKIYLNVFFQGFYVPQKTDGTYWYNLFKLPLEPIKTGGTQIFFDTTGDEDNSIELFAKNESGDLSEQTFECTPVGSGYHQIVIKDRTKPNPPTATPAGGDYTDPQSVTLHAENGCEIYYSLHGETPHLYHNETIEISTTTTITAYAKGPTGKSSNTVEFTYRILPKSPCLFEEIQKGAQTEKKLIAPSYTKNDVFSLYATDSETYGMISTGNEIYYTFSDITEDDVKDGQTLGEEKWTKLNSISQKIDITKSCKITLVTKKQESYSNVSTYYLYIRPQAPKANKDSGFYPGKIDVQLTYKPREAEVYYTLDESDPTSSESRILYNENDVITIAKDKTLRSVTKYDGVYSEVASYYYIFTNIDAYGVDAFYPSGTYEGSVNVTLTANNPENDIIYSMDNGTTWKKYEKTFLIENDKKILAKAGTNGVFDKDGVYTEGGTFGNVYNFTYTIKPLPPVFVPPENSQFSKTGLVSVYCKESTNASTENYDLYYTTDGSDPITNGIHADEKTDSVDITIDKYTVIKAVVLKDKKTYSSVVTHSYDIVTTKPAIPTVTLSPGNYIHEIDNTKGFETQFIPVESGTKIYYTINYDGTYQADPIPGVIGTQYDGNPIKIKGHTIIKAIAVDGFGSKSDVGIFEYTVTPEAPKAAPSATISGTTLPIIPVSAVTGSTVKYKINGFENSFECKNKDFYIDTQTGNAYEDKECTKKLGNTNTGTLSSPAVLNIKSELDGIESFERTYIYTLTSDSNYLAQPYADKDTGEYEEIKQDNENYLLYINLYSLNNGDTIEWKFNNDTTWNTYDGNSIKIKNDTILQIRSKKDGNYSNVASYVYHFVPLAPIITLPSGRYVLRDEPWTTEIEFDKRAPQDKNYQIWYRQNGDKREDGEDPDKRYQLGIVREIDHSMSFKAYVENKDTKRVSKNTIHYYIIQSDSAATGSIGVMSPYNKKRIGSYLLSSGDYAKGIKLYKTNNDAKLYYSYSYTMYDEETGTVNPTVISVDESIYDNIPITVNPSMASITIIAHLEDDNGKITGSDFTHTIEFVHLKIPQTSLGTSKVEYSSGTNYTLENDYPNDENIYIFYTLDGTTDPKNATTPYNGETLTISSAVTVRTRYFNSCGGVCGKCKDNKPLECEQGVWGDLGEFKYTVPTIINTGGGSSGGGGGSHIIDKTRKYTKDIFGNEHSAHIKYINGYPDGSVQPEKNMTREEVTSVLYRITNHEYETPFVATGNVFPDIDILRWSAHDIEYMEKENVVSGYPDGEFKPQNHLTRAEFATLICRFVKAEKSTIENPFNDLDETHWAYENILSLVESGLIEGYEDGTFRPGNEITRAEVMTVINKILGRNPSDSYVKSLDFNPYTDLDKDEWYYTAVLEATITHDYILDKNGVEEKWENWK